ncbi:MAG: DUF445 domain-containing protein [Desulfitobacteriaceae bacterium]
MNYKQKANITLTIVFILFFIAAICEHLWPKIFLVRICYFVFEAALIGGIADWFAITALFRKPLNWPFHTALIPRNREKVINSVSNMVQQDLLKLVSIKQKLEQINFNNYLIEWIEEGERFQYLIKSLSRTIESRLRCLNPEKVAAFFTPLLFKKLSKQQLSPLTHDFILKSLANGQVDSWLDSAIAKLDQIARQEATKTNIYNFLLNQKDEKVKQGSINIFFITMLEASGGLNLQEAAESLQSQLISTVESLKDREHPLRYTVREILRQSAAELEHNLIIQESMETWKEEIIAIIPLGMILEDAIKALQKSTEICEKSLIEAVLKTLWLFYRNNDSFSLLMNGYLRKAFLNIIEYNQTIIGDIARDALLKLTNEDLIRFIEDKAGNDLQWIRINGSIIGGLVGVILFLFLRLIYDPYVVPLFNRWLL